MFLTDEIKRKALQLGFDLMGVTDASPIDGRQAQSFSDWLASGFAGQMDYMHRNLEKRIHPAKLLENAQSVIVVGLNFKPAKPSPSFGAQRRRAEEPAEEKPISSSQASRSDARQSQIRDRTIPTGRVAQYAQYEDYHPFMKSRLRTLVNYISSVAGGGDKFKICVDSAPLAERALAARAGLGFIGKNHMLINPTLGPQIFLAEIITTVQLQYDQPTAGNCSTCTACIDACPTGALRPDGEFDANKCISYLTIEHKGQIRPELAAKIGDRLYGCDECVLACPYQQNAPACANKQFKFYGDRANPDLQRVLNMTQEDFDAEFTDSVISRLGLERLRRNAQICLENITNPARDSHRRE